ncbi:hypothetical protein WA016_02636 [Myxococcus stipitatus]
MRKLQRRADAREEQPRCQHSRGPALEGLGPRVLQVLPERGEDGAASLAITGGSCRGTASAPQSTTNAVRPRDYFEGKFAAVTCLCAWSAGGEAFSAPR